MKNRVTFDNGVRVIFEPIDYVRSVSVGFWVINGSIHENEETQGINHLIEHMLFKGTEKRTAQMIAKEMDRIGGHLNAFSSKEYSCYYAKVIESKLNSAVELLSDLLKNSIFNPEDLKCEKGVILEEINMYEDSPDELVHDVLSESFWGRTHPYGRTILGRKEVVEAFSRDFIFSYYKKKYVPKNLIISIAGKYNQKRVISKLKELLGSFESERQNTLAVDCKSLSKKNTLVKKDTEQIHISLGTHGCRYDSKNKYAQTIFNIILGGGMSSRLFQLLREKHGLVYSVYSYQTSYMSDGMFAVYIGTHPTKLDKVFRLIRKEFDEILEKGIDADEVQISKNQLKSSLLMGLESTSGVMNRIARPEIYGLHRNKIDTIIRKINKVRLEDVTRIAKIILNDCSFLISAVGNVEPGRTVLGEFNNLPFAVRGE